MSSPSRLGKAAFRPAERGNTRLVVPIAIAFLLGAGVATLWFGQRKPRPAAPVPQAQPAVLSESTRTVLHNLDAPVQIRYYDLLDPDTVSASVRDFAGRVDHLLSQYQSEANGKIELRRYSTAANFDEVQAAADGVQAFNFQKGSPSYLGVAVLCGKRKEALPHLSPDWEPALESDLTRAILRVTASAPSPVAAAKVDPAVRQEVQRLIPNLDSVSLEEGSRIIREHALQDFKAAAAEMQAQVQQAEQQLTQAQNGASAADQQAAMKHLQQLQADQVQKLKELAARSQAEIEALKQLKQSTQ